MRTRGWFAAIVLTLVASGAVFAQGVQTGTIRGAVRDQQSLALPGVTVTVTSPALQGSRVAVTDETGGYTFAALPPGPYTISYELSGFERVTRSTNVALGLPVELNVTLGAGAVSESVVVVAETPSSIASAVVGATFKQKEVEALAAPRTLAGIAEISPGLTNNTPNANQVSINGAFAFDNVFMINGVDVNDNLFGSPQNLFIEDAIQETQTLTSGISAEYGRFTGGVINAITKSGGNRFSGSFRDELTNPSWSTETPFEVARNAPHRDVTNSHYEGTLGGPIQRDRLWFFAAGRYENVSQSSSLPETGLANTQTDNNRRGEVKLTASFAPSHTLQGGYLNNRTENSDRPSFGFTIDRFGVDDKRTLPNSFYFTNYQGVLTKDTLIQAQYSQRKFGFRDSGGTSTSIVDSPFITLDTGRHYNAVFFDAGDPEDRNNRQFAASVTRYVNRAGRHELKGGYEFFRSERTGGNSQSATNYVFDADYLKNPADGTPLFDGEGHLIPVFVPGETQIENWLPTRGAALQVDTNSLYAQDHWALDRHWSADLGVRYERVRSEATGAILGVDTNAIVPRLAVAFDPRGDGRYVAHATYGHYAGRYDEAQIGANNNVGNPDAVFGTYNGPAGAGRDFAPGFDPANYTTDTGSFPTANVSLADGLSSPITKEFTASFGTALKSRGYAEGTYVWRRTGNIIEDFIDIRNGVTDVVRDGTAFGRFTNLVLDNTDVARRDYQALLFQGRYQITPRWLVSGNYTVMLQNEGNYEGEGANTPGLTSRVGDYPEIFNAARHFPTGRLQDYQQHKLRLWSVYDFQLGRAGTLAASGLWRYNSGTVFSFAALNEPLSDTQQQLLDGAGYPDSPQDQTLFFGDRGAEVFPGYGLVDASVNYELPVFGSVRPWLKFDVFNLFDNLKLISFNTTVIPDADSPTDSLGLPTGFVRDVLFGQADSNRDFPVPLPGVTGGRTFRVAFGVRF